MSTSTVASILRTSQAYCAQLCEKQTLEFGIVYACDRYPTSPEANQYREIIADNEADLERAWSEAGKCFAEQAAHGCTWATAVGVPPVPMATFLTARGFQERKYTAMRLEKWMEFAPQSAIRVVPARAVRSAFRDAVTGDSRHGDGAGDTPVRPALLNDRLDDPHLDMFVALIDGKPAGHCGLLQVGDIARVIEWGVVQGGSASQASDTTTALHAHVLRLAQRLMMKTICAQVLTDDRATIAQFDRAGFVADGEILEYVPKNVSGRFS